MLQGNKKRLKVFGRKFLRLQSILFWVWSLSFWLIREITRLIWLLVFIKMIMESLGFCLQFWWQMVRFKRIKILTICNQVVTKSSLTFVLSWLMEFKMEKSVEFMINLRLSRFRVSVEQDLFFYLLTSFMSFTNHFNFKRKSGSQIQPGQIIIRWSKVLGMNLPLIGIMI